MAQKTADIGSEVESTGLGQDDANDFLERLDTFRDSLPEAEKSILSQMVIDASGEPAEQSNGQAAKAEPTGEDMESFKKKLNAFHDELPGDQHLYVDELLAKTWYQDEAEVQGYHWDRISPWIQIPNKQRFAYADACFAIGGDKLKWKKYTGEGHMWVACFDNTHS